MLSHDPHDLTSCLLRLRLWETKMLQVMDLGKREFDLRLPGLFYLSVQIREKHQVIWPTVPFQLFHRMVEYIGARVRNLDKITIDHLKAVVQDWKNQNQIEQKTGSDMIRGQQNEQNTLIPPLPLATLGPVASKLPVSQIPRTVKPFMFAQTTDKEKEPAAAEHIYSTSKLEIHEPPVATHGPVAGKFTTPQMPTLKRTFPFAQSPNDDEEPPAKRISSIPKLDETPVQPSVATYGPAVGKSTMRRVHRLKRTFYFPQDPDDNEEPPAAEHIALSPKLDVPVEPPAFATYGPVAGNFTIPQLPRLKRKFPFSQARNEQPAAENKVSLSPTLEIPEPSVASSGTQAVAGKSTMQQTSRLKRTFPFAQALNDDEETPADERILKLRPTLDIPEPPVVTYGPIAGESAMPQMPRLKPQFPVTQVHEGNEVPPIAAKAISPTKDKVTRGRECATRSQDSHSKKDIGSSTSVGNGPLSKGAAAQPGDKSVWVESLFSCSMCIIRGRSPCMVLKESKGQKGRSSRACQKCQQGKLKCSLVTELGLFMKPIPPEIRDRLQGPQPHLSVSDFEKLSSNRNMSDLPTLVVDMLSIARGARQRCADLDKEVHALATFLGTFKLEMEKKRSGSGCE